MAQAQFVYREDAGIAADADFGEAVRLPLAVSIFADRVHVRELIRDDARAAGLRVGQCGDLAMLLGREAVPLGEVVLVDCPALDAARLAALARLDMRAARSAAQLVVATTVEALDDVFACLDQSGAQILVSPTRSEWVVALGRALGGAAQLRLREFSEQDRIQLLRLAEQVETIARRLGGHDSGLSPSAALAEGGTLQFESPGVAFRSEQPGGVQLLAQERLPLPDPRLVRRIIRQRQLRARFFDGDLFADPAWDILLDLTVARAERVRVSVTSLCIASCVPPTTALRWIGQMTEAGLLERVEDQSDRRRAFIALTDRAANAMAHYFAESDRITAQAA